MSKIRQVMFLPLVDAIQLIPRDGVAMISITDPGVNNEVLFPDWQDVLFLQFHDIDPTKFKTLPNGTIPFDVDAAQQIIGFLGVTEDHIHTIIVHCHAGASRSGAVAKFIAELYDLSFNHDYDSYNPFVYKTLRDEYVRMCLE